MSSRAKTIWNLGTAILEATIGFLAKQKAEHLEEENAVLKEMLESRANFNTQLVQDLERTKDDLARVSEERDHALRQLREVTSPA